ncbi:MAG: hypothetical protein QXK54_04545 [Ignisphaera sp.]
MKKKVPVYRMKEDGSLELVSEIDERSAMAIVEDDTVPDKIVIVYEEEIKEEELMPVDESTRIHEFDIREIMKDLEDQEKKRYRYRKK